MEVSAHLCWNFLLYCVCAGILRWLRVENREGDRFDRRCLRWVSVHFWCLIFSLWLLLYEMRLDELRPLSIALWPLFSLNLINVHLALVNDVLETRQTIQNLCFWPFHFQWVFTCVNRLILFVTIVLLRFCIRLVGIEGVIVIVSWLAYVRWWCYKVRVVVKFIEKTLIRFAKWLICIIFDAIVLSHLRADLAWIVHNTSFISYKDAIVNSATASHLELRLSAILFWFHGWLLSQDLALAACEGVESLNTLGVLLLAGNRSFHLLAIERQRIIVWIHAAILPLWLVLFWLLHMFHHRILNESIVVLTCSMWWILMRVVLEMRERFLFVEVGHLELTGAQCLIVYFMIVQSWHNDAWIFVFQTVRFERCWNVNI